MFPVHPNEIRRLEALRDLNVFGSPAEPQFDALYTQLRVLSNLLKTNFFGSASPLNLKLPASAASDTD